MCLQTNSMWCNRSPRSVVIQINFLSWKLEKCVSLVEAGDMWRQGLFKKDIFFCIGFFDNKRNENRKIDRKILLLKVLIKNMLLYYIINCLKSLPFFTLTPPHLQLLLFSIFWLLFVFMESHDVFLRFWERSERKETSLWNFFFLLNSSPLFVFYDQNEIFKFWANWMKF